jgi:hypothetical protein
VVYPNCPLDIPEWGFHLGPTVWILGPVAFPASFPKLFERSSSHAGYLSP